MKFKKIIIWLIVVIVILVGGNYSIRKYLYPYKYEEIVNKWVAVINYFIDSLNNL